MDAYSMLRTVGRGATGVVHLCRRKSDNALVIIKLIPIEEMTTEERQAALNEVKVIDQLDHPNIVAYYDSFFENKALHIVMEYAEGGTIFEYLQSRGGDLLEEREIMSLFVQMVLALQTIHSHNILHRDLKTQNIMLDRRKRIVKTGDFGISKVLSSKSKKAHTVVGTPCYISPELCEGKAYDQKSDIWALGCVLYEMVTLRRAFDAPNLPALVLKIMRGQFAPIAEHYSEDLRGLILQLLYLDPVQRPRLTQILALPICQNALLDLHTDMGLIPSFRHGGAGASKSEAGLRASIGNAHNTAPTTVKGAEVSAWVQGTKIFTWGGGICEPRMLGGVAGIGAPIGQIHVDRTQHVAVSDGQVLAWRSQKARRSGAGTGGSGDSGWLPKVIPGLQGVVVTHIACGTSFSACLSDRGIVMTFGSGAQGCLGHGDYEDVAQPRINESLLGFEVTNLTAGAAHVVAVTNEHEVFTWGCGDNGRLGHGDDEGHCAPQQISELTSRKDAFVQFSVCGDDCTFFVATDGSLLACGSNRYNKIGLMDLSKIDEIVVSADPTFVSAQEFYSPQRVTAVDRVKKVVTGASHTVILTLEGRLLSFGLNTSGQLGRKTESGDRPAMLPTPVIALKDIVINDVECGDYFTLAVTGSNELYGWGKTAEGRLATREVVCDMVPKLVELHTLIARGGSEVPQTVIIERLSCHYGSTMIVLAANPDLDPTRSPIRGSSGSASDDQRN